MCVYVCEFIVIILTADVLELLGNKSYRMFYILMTSKSIADDVTRTRQLWRDGANNDM